MIRASKLSPQAAECLTDRERERAAKFVFECDGQRWASFRAALRTILADYVDRSPGAVPIEIDDQGKPFLAEASKGWHFNLSHSNVWMLVLVSAEGPVGVDFEPWSRGQELLDYESDFCHPAEIADLPATKDERAKRLIAIWTAKEAVLKALGTGLTHPPQQVLIRGDQACSDDTHRPIHALRIHSLELPGLERFCVAAALPHGVAPPALVQAPST